MTNNNEKKMTLKKQLMAAIAMLMVAAVALTSATYAWFANNNSVEGKGMTVNAEAESSLLIAGSEDSNYTNYGSVGTNNLSELTLKPVTSYDATTFAGLNNTAKVTSSGSSVATDKDGNALAGDDLTTVTSGYATCKYSLQAKGKADKTTDVYVDSITISRPEGGNTSSINKSLRVSITIKETYKDGEETKTRNVTHIYAPDMDNPEGGTAGTTLVGKYDTDAKTWSLVAPVYATTGSSTTDGWTLDNGKAVDANIKIWFEGQDKDCYSDNISTKDWSIVIKFAKPADA